MPITACFDLTLTNYIVNSNYTEILSLLCHRQRDFKLILQQIENSKKVLSSGLKSIINEIEILTNFPSSQKEK